MLDHPYIHSTTVLCDEHTDIHVYVQTLQQALSISVGVLALFLMLLTDQAPPQMEFVRGKHMYVYMCTVTYMFMHPLHFPPPSPHFFSLSPCRWAEGEDIQEFWEVLRLIEPLLTTDGTRKKDFSNRDDFK